MILEEIRKKKFESDDENCCTCEVVKLSDIELVFEKRCHWRDEDESVYSTDCGHNFYFVDAPLSEQNFKYCPYCGLQIEEIIKEK